MSGWPKSRTQRNDRRAPAEPALVLPLNSVLLHIRNPLNEVDILEIFECSLYFLRHVSSCSIWNYGLFISGVLLSSEKLRVEKGMKMTFNSASLAGYWWCCISNYDELLTKKGKKIYALSPPPQKVYRRRSVSLLFLQLAIRRYYFGHLFFPFLVCVLVSL